MTDKPKASWRMSGDEVASCNCAWGCPCQFNAIPTHGRCDGIAAFQINEGNFGAVPLDGLRFALLAWTPGPLHEGNGTRQIVIDHAATQEQRDALRAITNGTKGGALWEIFSAMLPNVVDTIFVPIEFASDRKTRVAHVRIPGVLDVRTEPIKNPVTGQEHKARISLPEGFEYREAEMANAVTLRVQSSAPLVFEYSGTYAQLNAFDWSNS